MSRTITPEIEELLNLDHRIARDIKSRWERWGTLSDAQLNLLRRLKADADVNWAPAPHGPQTVTATVLSCKWRDTPWGESLKMTVRVDGTDGSWRAWGTVPRAIREALADDDDLVGCVVEFSATFTVSDDDTSFAFFKRPKDARIVRKNSQAA